MCRSAVIKRSNGGAHGFADWNGTATIQALKTVSRNIVATPRIRPEKLVRRYSDVAKIFVQQSHVCGSSCTGISFSLSESADLSLKGTSPCLLLTSLDVRICLDPLHW